MRIAVIGSGISGNLAARILATQHHVDVFEAGTHLGGHAHTVEVEAYGKRVAIDVAFMVYNRRTYPNFCRMLELLGVDGIDSDMSLSVRCFRTGLEYQGSSLSGIFAQRSNLFRPRFLGMLRDIIRFNRRAIEFCHHQRSAESNGSSSVSGRGLLLREFLKEIGTGEAFYHQYLVPMSAAIWSANPSTLGEFPAKFILGFLHNHGLLNLNDRPQWLTPKLRSQDYVRALRLPEDQVFLNSPVANVRRTPEGVTVETSDGQQAVYDHVVCASHSDQTLKMLADADSNECSVLSAIPYQSNDAVLHTDASILPTRRRAWASWNYHIPENETERVSVTYDLNRLQSLGLPGPLCLTLNPNRAIDPSHVIKSFEFEHPVFTKDSIAAQDRFAEINGKRGVSFCGAYWGYGFHEDGAKSALAVTEPLGLSLDAIKDPVISSQMQNPPASHLRRDGSKQSAGVL